MADPATPEPEPRRRDDRLKNRIFLLALVLSVYLMATSTYGRFQAEWDRDATTQRSQVAGEERARAQQSLDDAQRKIDQQQRDLACFADNTTAFERAISGVIVASVREGQVPPERQKAALEELERVNKELSEAKTLCQASSTTTQPR